MEERTDCCKEKKNWVYDEGATVVYCSVCGKVVFDGPDADFYGYEEAE